ncbi:hypothetical protein NPIL_257261, partial [Nephila pilipes]
NINDIIVFDQLNIVTNGRTMFDFANDNNELKRDDLALAPFNSTIKSLAKVRSAKVLF